MRNLQVQHGVGLSAARDGHHAADAAMAAYATLHADRRNLIVHVATVPVFMLGTIALVASVATLSWPLAVAGLAAKLGAIGAQGAAHRLEARPFTGFGGAWAAIRGLFVEQWVTFPRYVARGDLARVWRNGRRAG